MSRHSSSSVLCPAASAWRCATGGHSTTSPSTPREGSSGVPSRSSSMGKDITSVAPGSSSHFSCSWAI
ncbi:hypothetical protein ACJ65_03675 [Kocuria rhizophila]|nr:hypothetical protein ACJ65_03675 [Kocuria rhizophila]